MSEAACTSSRLLATLRTESSDPLEVPTPDFKVATASAAVEFLEHHVVEPFADIEPPLKQPFEDCISTWDRSFLTAVQQRGPTAVAELLTFACYLDIPQLRSLCSASLASSLQSCGEHEVFGQLGVDPLSDAAVDKACSNFPWLQQ